MPTWHLQQLARVIFACAGIAAICSLVTRETQAGRSTFRSDPDYLIDTWETEDGLPENSATAMVQTSDGYLWFGTFNGLVRFDGVKFTVLNPANTLGLPSGAIINLHLDHTDRLWVSTDRGLVVQDGKSWRSFGTNEGWAGNFVRTFAERTNGDLLMTTFDGHVLEWVNDRLRELPPPPTGKPGLGYYGAADGNGQWWATQQQFVGRWDGQHWVQTLLSSQELTEPAVPCAGARDGGVWVLFGTDLLKYRQGTEVARGPLPGFTAGRWSLSEDSRSNVWVCSYNEGLFRLNAAGDLRHWSTTNGLSYNGCRFVFEDHEGNLWVGTSGGGLQRFKPRRFHDMSVASSLSGRVVRSVAPASEGGMWVATYDGGLFRHGESRVPVVSYSGPQSRSPYGLSVLEDSAGRVWYGEKDACWWRRGPANFEKVELPWSTDVNLSALFEDAQGRIWMSAAQGVVLYDGKTLQELGADAGLPRGGVACFGADSAGVPLLAASQGVFRYAQGRLTEVRTIEGKSLRNVLCFKADSDGTLWMGTRAEGLLRLRDRRLSRIGAAAGLPVEAVHAILEDKLGYFWMPSNRGIVRASRTNLSTVADGDMTHLDCQLLDRNDGLPSDHGPIGQPTCARDAAGRLWFATEKSVAMIDPAAFRLNSLPPPVRVEQLSYELIKPSPASSTGVAFNPHRNTEVRLAAPFAGSIQLPPGSYGLEIQYTALSHSAAQKIRFQFRLDDVSGDWEDVEDRRFARFYELQPGDYVFRVRAANNDGVWNETGASLAFTVLPFYWQTGWFRAGIIFLVLNLGGFTTWWRVRRRHRREMEELERVRQQQAEIAHLSRVNMLGELAGSLAHELNQPLTAILSNAQAAQRFLSHDRVDLNEVIEILSDIVAEDKRAGEVIRRLRLLLKKGEVQHQPLHINDVVQEVLKLVRSDLVNQGVAAQTVLAPNLPVVEGDPVQLQQVLLNLVINACDAMAGVARDERLLTIYTALDGDQSVRVSVADCGAGIDPQKLEQVFNPFFTTKPHGMGLGLAVCRTIITAHGGKLWAANNPGRGATFHFTLGVGGGKGGDR